MAGSINVKTKSDLAKLVGSRRAKAVDPKTGKAKTLAPPLPTHDPGTMDEIAEPYREKFDSNDEKEFADYLDQQKLGGHILEWAYKPVRLRIGDGAFYSPDFRVVWANRSTTYYEIKGFLREAARVRLRVAAERHPSRFVMVRKRSKRDGGGWTILYDTHAKREA